MSECLLGALPLFELKVTVYVDPDLDTETVSLAADRHGIRFSSSRTVPAEAPTDIRPVNKQTKFHLNQTCVFFLNFILQQGAALVKFQSDAKIFPV